MSVKRFCALPFAALLLTACAHQSVGEPQASPEPAQVNASGSYIGVGVESLPASAIGDYMGGVFTALNQSLARSDVQQWQVIQLTDGSILLRAWTATGFETDSAELRPLLLDSLNRIAGVAKTFNKTIVHILANGRDASVDAFSQSLSDRRAAALAAYLDAQGFDDRRMRYEGASQLKPGMLQILIRPVVTGAEAQAWMSSS